MANSIRSKLKISTISFLVFTSILFTHRLFAQTEDWCIERVLSSEVTRREILAASRQFNKAVQDLFSISETKITRVETNILAVIYMASALQANVFHLASLSLVSAQTRNDEWFVFSKQYVIKELASLISSINQQIGLIVKHSTESNIREEARVAKKKAQAI